MEEHGVCSITSWEETCESFSIEPKQSSKRILDQSQSQSSSDIRILMNILQSRNGADGLQMRFLFTKRHVSELNFSQSTRVMNLHVLVLWFCWLRSLVKQFCWSCSQCSWHPAQCDTTSTDTSFSNNLYHSQQAILNSLSTPELVQHTAREKA
jgi:hypothetical protein